MVLLRFWILTYWLNSFCCERKDENNIQNVYFWGYSWKLIYLFMKTISSVWAWLPLFFLLFAGGRGLANNPDPDTDPFGQARWIAFMSLDDSLKVVPAARNSGDELGNKGKARSVVPLFRKEFRAPGAVKKATIHICGLGHYVLYVNGNRIGDRFLSPGWTLYQKRCLYNTYDITDQVRKGNNAIGVMVGNGFYNVNRERYRKLVIAYGYPRLIYALTIEMQDGTVTTVLSDVDTKVAPSPVVFASIYGGEDYDARLEQKNWDKAGFDDSKWANALVLNDTIGKLTPETDYPLKVMQTFGTKEIRTSQTGRVIYDFGQNTSGIIDLKVKGNKGAKIIIRPDELLNKEGNVTQVSGHGPYELSYILKGEGVEHWKPCFTYYGFRYADVGIVEPEGSDKKTKIVEMSLLHTRNSSPGVGSFACSDTLFNQIFELINWGIKSNMASVATDCPHREKLGWLEQTYLIGPSMHYNFHIQSLYNKIVDDMMDSQLDNGLVPDIAPEYVHFEGGFRDSPEWGSAAVIIPWLLYQWYGDREVLSRAYPMMKRYVAYLHGKSNNSLLDYGLGDWYDLGPKPPGVAQLTPKAVTATAIYYYDLQLMKKISEILRQEDDNQLYGDLSSKVRSAFLDKFYHAGSGVVSTGSQTAYAMALYTGLIPEEGQERVFQNLVDSIARNNYGLTAGDIGYHFLVRVLSKNKRSDIIYKMNRRTDVPGYGYQLKMGATALTESWAALPRSSNNHMMLGHLMEWFYNGLGGILQKDHSVAYDSIWVAPKPVGDIKWVKCSYQSVKGTIASNWEVKDDKFVLEVEIPRGVVATIILPEDYCQKSCEAAEITSGKSIDVSRNRGRFDVGAGKYRISSQ